MDSMDRWTVWADGQYGQMDGVDRWTGGRYRQMDGVDRNTRWFGNFK